MEVKRAILVIADISGYTSFMTSHTQSLLHAEAIITDLLNAVIDKAEFPLTLSKLEGDAVFLYALLDADPQQARTTAQGVANQLSSFFDAFRLTERSLIACNTCICTACANISQLKLKVFLHVGEVVIKQVRQFEELAGTDVILVHRLLKNDIPAKEYIAMTDAFYDLSGGLADQTPEARTENAEGIGAVGIKVYYRQPDPEPMPTPPPITPPVPGTALWEVTERWSAYANGRMAGRIPQPEFSHLPHKTFNRLSTFRYYVVGQVRNAFGMIPYLLGIKKQRY